MTRSRKIDSIESKLNYARPLLRWFDRYHRDLPWRKKKSPYRIWISEIMLQQTQVKTVIDYYQRFMARFPTVTSLADADESEVLKLWEGLGYYRRAKHLHAAAKIIANEYSGVFPTNLHTVLRLPGVGRYTAGAILSISLDQRLPILEGNTIRLYSRLLALKTDPKLAINQTKMWEFAAAILPRHRPGDFNQALMELGSEVCTLKLPACDRCPLVLLCPTHARGLSEQIPVAAKKQAYESVHEAIILLNRKGRYLTRICQPGERWTGLYDFPRFRTIGTDSGKVDSDQFEIEDLARQFKSEYGFAVRLKKVGWSTRHAVTRYRIQLTSYEAFKLGRIGKAKKPFTSWLTMEELADLPMSVTGRRLVAWLMENRLS